MQTGGLLKDYTVEETVKLTAVLFGRPAAAVGKALERAGIADIGKRLVGKCSGGQQQRLRFAMALLPDPELLILDEPTTGMDVGGRHDFWTAIRQDAQGGRTIIFATHYLEEADAYADRVVFVRRGRIVADGTAAEVRALASGRTVRATLPGATEAELTAIAGVDTAEVRGDTVYLHAGDTDAVARHLLNHTAARDLEITSKNLEDAFLALTADDASTDGSTK
jgi:ABC-2 type transport system ATP-binding protein